MKTEKKYYFDFLICLAVILFLFIPTLNRPWLLYDESILYKGLYFPTITSLTEFIEYIKNFGLDFNIISANSIYSFNSVRRNVPLGQLFGIIISSICKNNPFNFHLLNLFFHLINSFFIYLILGIFLKDINEHFTKRFLRIILTIIWAIHPVMIEPVLLSINVGATYSYMFLFFMLYIFLKKEKATYSILEIILIPILFLIPMLTNEYIITLPFIIFIFSFCKIYKENNFLNSIIISFKNIYPFIIGFILYFIYFIFLSKYSSKTSSSLNIILERILWLSPQIFFHDLKLIFYPHILSIDQSLFVKLGKSLFDLYSIFCFVLFFSFLFIPSYLFLIKKKLKNLFCFTWTFFFSILPFLHILMPSYTLSCERYLYIPFAMLIFGISYSFINFKIKKNIFIPIMILMAILCFSKSYIRSQDWKSNESFISSSYKTSPSYLFKAVRLGLIGKSITFFHPEKTEEVKKYFIESIELLNKAKIEVLNKNSKTLPKVIKSYGLDSDSTLAKIAFLETSSRCIELNEDPKNGINILSPFMKDLRTIDPNFIELYSYLLIKNSEYEKAKEILFQAYEIYPEDQTILLSLFNYYLNIENNLIEAEKILNKLLFFYKHNSSILEKGIVFYSKTNSTELLAKYCFLFALRTKSKEAYINALNLYSQINDENQCKKITELLKELFPNDPLVLQELSKYSFRKKYYIEAKKYLEKAFYEAKKDNSNPILLLDITINLSKLYLYTGENEKGIEIAKALINYNASDIVVLSTLSDFYKSIGLNEYENLCLDRIKVLKNEKRK